LDYTGQSRQSDGTYLTDVLTDEAIQFVRWHQQDPFFLCLMYNAPHSPLQAPEEIIKRYYDLGLRPSVAITYAMIEAMDVGLGRLMAELDRQQLAENTIVMFTSDNGPAFMVRSDQLPADMDRNTTRFNCGFAGAKGSVYEGGIRVPMVMRWPAALRAGITVDRLVHFTDWFPTLLNLASVTRRGGLPLDGHDISSILHGEPLQQEPRRFWQFNGYYPIAGINAAMRDGDWKAVYPSINIPFASVADEAMAAKYVELDIEYKYYPERISEIRTDLIPEQVIPKPPSAELYNIHDDPLEQNNLAAREPERLAQMLNAVETWFEEVVAEGMHKRSQG
jgi:arylsulfatase A